MKTSQEQYREKFCSAEAAASLIDEGSNLMISMGVSMPPALLYAITERARSGSLSHLKAYYMHASAHAGESILSPDVMQVIKPYSLFMSGYDREIAKLGRSNGQCWMNYVPSTFHQVGRLMTETIGADAFIATVSPMDQHGYFSLGTNSDYGTEVARNCGKLIVEVNRSMPRVFGEALIHISEVDALVENSCPLLEVLPAEPGVEDDLIARQIVAQIPDGATIQMGVGGVPNAVAAYLREHNDLGLHSELLAPGLVDLIRRGVITGRRKTLHRLKHLFTLALGDRKMYEFMDDNPSLAGYPASYINDPRIIARNDDMISVNSALQVDLSGQINAEYLQGKEFSGPGGQLDFVRGAYASRGGKSFVALHSTAKNGSLSRIVPQLDGPATDPRMDTHHVVTEYGMVNLKGLSLNERAKALISLAHPDFRDALGEAAVEQGVAS
ncbi:acetyl-CoA hydrolase/transferase family protein [Kiloniella laminariae]|uniref:acetyl-CoA hydrolase/transferase family protein n=1 Tax=Kiloniella laminariae TaxID=454162 RepID=UPI0003A4E15F|nr:acetyl-CoA hydrolase/transferase C-terminal domain-containing protein [Kiloniella laminariae]